MTMLLLLLKLTSREISTFLSTELPSDLPHASAHNRVIALLDLGVDDDGVPSGVHVLRVTQLQGKKRAHSNSFINIYLVFLFKNMKEKEYMSIDR